MSAYQASLQLSCSIKTGSWKLASHVAACGKAWAGQASNVEELEEMLPSAIEAVIAGRSAILDAHVNAPSSF